MKRIALPFLLLPLCVGAQQAGTQSEPAPINASPEERAALQKNFVRNTAALLASEELCQYTVNMEMLGLTFPVYSLKPDDIAPGGRLHEELLRNKKHIAAATQDDAGRGSFCDRVKQQLGVMLR